MHAGLKSNRVTREIKRKEETKKQYTSAGSMSWRNLGRQDARKLYANEIYFLTISEESRKISAGLLGFRRAL